MRSPRAALLAVSLLVLGTAGCNGSDGPDGSARNAAIRIYGADGNMTNSFADSFKDHPGLLQGMTGTTPLTPLSDGFKGRLKTVDSRLTDFAYSGESYDAVVISAVAAELAGSNRPARIARYIDSVTDGGEICDNPRDCLRLARSGKDLQYRGISMRRSGFTDLGEPSTASYATLHFGVGDRIDEGKTEFVGAGDEASSSTQQQPPPRPSRSGGQLKIGGLMPQTGPAKGFYRPMHAGATLAVTELNDAGGVLGHAIEWVDADDGTDPVVAKRSLGDLITANVGVIVGPGASGISRAILPTVVKAGIVMVSPTNTAADLSNVKDDGFYFRTAPSDVLQGKALADVIMRDGAQRVAIVGSDNAYGNGLIQNVRDSLLAAGRTEAQIQSMTYPDGQTTVDFTAGARQVKSFRPDAVLVIGLAESAGVIIGLSKAGLAIQH